MVLLKNEGQTLPLDATKTAKIAVIGEPATVYCGGGGSASGLPQYYKNPFDSVKAAVPDTSQVAYCPGLKLHRCIPMANPGLLTNADGPSVEVNFYANSDKELSTILHQEKKPVPIVFILGHIPAGLDERHGFTYEMKTNLTPTTSGCHTFAVLATGAFQLLVDDEEILSQDEPEMSVEDFLFEPYKLEKQFRFTMQASKPYSIRLITKSRRQLGIDEPTPHSSKLCFLEEFSDDDAIKAAGEIAASNDISIVFAGRNSEWEGEGSDMDSILLPRQQDELIKHVALRSKKTIVVLIGGNPFDVRQWVNEVDAVLFAHLPGQGGGAAIADIIFGKICPGGKLPMSWPSALEDLPSNQNFPCKITPNGPDLSYEEGLRVGYRHFWSSEPTASSSALWDFGHGLSYTTFEMETPRVMQSRSPDGELLLTVEVTVQNTGDIAGAEVVQVYIEDVVASVWRPSRELKGFEKVVLQPGEKVTAKIVMLGRYALSFWNQKRKCWIAERGEFVFHVGKLKASYVLEHSFSWNGL